MSQSQEGDFFANETNKQNNPRQNGQTGQSTAKPTGIDPRIACSAETRRNPCFVQGGGVKYLPF